ncbi:MAG: TPR end-of-group domain-containing protein [Terriglobales bacterium]
MKKKTTARVKKSPANPKKRKAVKKGPAAAPPSRAALQRRLAPLDDPRVAQAVQNYEAGLKAMQEHKFERAKGLLEKVVAGTSRELADRAAMHLNTCVQHLERTTTSFRSPEEHYDYAISLMNAGDFADARTHLEKIRKQAPKADYAVYGLAVLDCLTGHMEDSLRNLAEAIRLSPGARLQARNDSDFQNLADDPRFTELLYPEEGVEAASPGAPSKER